MAITALPTPPERGDAANFAARADAFLGALPIFGAEANALQADVNAKQLAAAASAVTAINAPGTSATSTTSLTVGTGSRSLAVQTAKSFVVGMFVAIARTADPTRWMVGSIGSYNSGTGALTVNVVTANNSGTYADWTVSLSAPISFTPATAAQVRAGGVDSAAVTPAGLYAAAGFVALAYGSSIAVDLNGGINFTITLTANATLAAPTNPKDGQSGIIAVVQGTGGSRLLAYASAWDFGDAGAPTLSTLAGSVNLIGYVVVGGIVCASQVR